MNQWIKQGLIWTINKKNYWQYSHTQCPIVDMSYKDKWRIYYSSRTFKGESSIHYIDVEVGNPKNILYVSSEPVLIHGDLGNFDDCGVMPTSIVTVNNKKYLYFIGWTKKTTVPYHNSIGLAVDYGSGFTKMPGPIISTRLREPGFQGTAFVIKDDCWKMWYLSSVGWFQDPESSIKEPLYHIKYANSINGIDWDLKDVCIPLRKDEGGIASASVINDNGKLLMWYCYRGVLDYRNDKSVSYRIGYAESNNFIDWIRKDDQVGIDRSDLGWDSQMMCYPYVIKYNNKLYMFYNGNGFGQSGFGYATKDLI